MARPDLHGTRMLGFRPIHLDAVTTLIAGLANGLPTVRHRSGVTPAILGAYARAGLVVEEELHPYAEGDEAYAIANRLVARGFRLSAPYPLPPGRFRDADHLVPPALWRRLNAKDRLGDLVPPAHRMDRRVLTPDAVRRMPFEGPVWLKAAGRAATGWGFAVRHAPDRPARDAGAAELAALGAEGIVVEDDAGPGPSWCVSIAVGEGGTRYAGMAEQVFAAPGRQSGSRVDPATPLPDAARALAVAVGETARALGFRGLAGLDIGRARDGRLVVFDPNFRFNASSAQAMLHDAAAARSGLPASRSVQIARPDPMETLIARSDGAVAEGWFVPTRLLDASLLPAAEGLSLVTGFVLGHDAADAARRAGVLAARLAGG